MHSIGIKINDRVVVITGGTKGLGKELALQFSKEGAHVIVASRHASGVEHVSPEIHVESILCDVTKESDVENLAHKVIELYGRIDIWINNAGVWLPHAPIEETDWHRVHEMFEINVFGTVYGSKTALIQMRKQQSGTIINVLSTSALEGRPGSSGYCASKFAASGFTKSLSKEVEGTHIQVFGIYPGGMQTGFFDEKKPDNVASYMRPEFVASKIIENLKQENPEEELVIRRPA